MTERIVLTAPQERIWKQVQDDLIECRRREYDDQSWEMYIGDQLARLYSVAAPSDGLRAQLVSSASGLHNFARWAKQEGQHVTQGWRDCPAEACTAVRAALAATEQREGLDVRPEVVQWFHDGEEQCDHDYSPTFCELAADALLESFTVEPRIYENADGTARFQREHFGRLHRAALRQAAHLDEQVPG